MPQQQRGWRPAGETYLPRPILHMYPYYVKRHITYVSPLTLLVKTKTREYVLVSILISKLRCCCQIKPLQHSRVVDHRLPILPPDRGGRVVARPRGPRLMFWLPVDRVYVYKPSTRQHATEHCAHFLLSNCNSAQTLTAGALRPGRRGAVIVRAASDVNTRYHTVASLLLLMYIPHYNNENVLHQVWSIIIVAALTSQYLAVYGYSHQRVTLHTDFRKPSCW